MTQGDAVRAIQRSRLLRSFLRILATIALAIAAVVCIFVSPALFANASNASDDWSFRANVGQAYGGIAALVSSIALFCIAFSLILQRRQALIEAINGERQRHLEIVQMAIADPDLLEIIDSVAARSPNGRKEVYANLFIGHLHAMWRSDEISAAGLRLNARMMFESPIARDYWARMRTPWRDAGESRKRASFVDLLDDEWRKAGQRDPDPESPGIEAAVLPEEQRQNDGALHPR